MPEELTKAAGQAAGTLSQTTWGALLLLSWILFGIVLWWVVSLMRKDITAERSSHQDTRAEYISVLKGKDQIAAVLITLTDGQKVIADNQQKQTSLLIDALSSSRRSA